MLCEVARMFTVYPLTCWLGIKFQRNLWVPGVSSGRTLLSGLWPHGPGIPRRHRAHGEGRVTAVHVTVKPMSYTDLTEALFTMQSELDALHGELTKLRRTHELLFHNLAAITREWVEVNPDISNLLHPRASSPPTVFFNRFFFGELLAPAGRFSKHFGVVHSSPPVWSTCWQPRLWVCSPWLVILGGYHYWSVLDCTIVEPAGT